MLKLVKNYWIMKTYLKHIGTESFLIYENNLMHEILKSFCFTTMKKKLELHP